MMPIQDVRSRGRLVERRTFRGFFPAVGVAFDFCRQGKAVRAGGQVRLASSREQCSFPGNSDGYGPQRVPEQALRAPWRPQDSEAAFFP